MRNIRLDLCYDGTRYNGWQRQTSHDNTIQGKLETALSRILGEPIEISASGRTDTGVHARGQVANFHTDAAMSCAELLAELRKYLPEDIGIYSCREVSPRFHARLNALEKTYQYRLWNSDRPCVFDFLALRHNGCIVRKPPNKFCCSRDFLYLCRAKI